MKASKLIVEIEVFTLPNSRHEPGVSRIQTSPLE